MSLFDSIFPILALALAGYVATRSGFLKASDCDALAKFTFNLVIPCLLFINIASSEIPANYGLDFLSAYYLAALLSFFISLVLGRYLLHYQPVAQSVFAISATYSNTTIVGIPLVLQTLGPEAMLPLFLLIAVQNLILFIVATISAEREHLAFPALLKTLGLLLKQLLSSPLTASLIAGLCFNLLNIPIYTPLAETIGLMAAAAVPAALFVLGTSLYQFRIRGKLGAATLITGIKLVLLPLLVYVFAFKVFTLDPLWAGTALLASAMPVGISAYVFATRYRQGQAEVAAGSLISAVACLLPVAVILHFFAGA